MFASKAGRGYRRLLSVGLCALGWGALTVSGACADGRPRGVSGPEAEALAHAMRAAVDAAAWDRTGAVRWTFRGDRHHLWDRQRSLARVGWDKVEVWLDLRTRDGVVYRNGVRLSGPKAEKLLGKAFAHWTNDSFWLNPIVKLFDDGTRRSLVALEEGGQGLLVEYTSGGLTPGDAYLWIVGEDGLPTAWRMWTSNLPVGGMRATWEGWTRLATGALVATRHDLTLGKVELTRVAGAADLASLEPAPDPFGKLLAPEEASPSRDARQGN